MWREGKHLLRAYNYATGMVTFHMFSYSMERSHKRTRAGKRPDLFQTLNLNGLDEWRGDGFPETRKSMHKSTRKKGRGPPGGGTESTGLDQRVYVGREGHRP